MTLKKNAQRTIVFVMIDSSDTKLVKTGLTVSAQVSKDGGSFNASSNSVAEIANGFYTLTLTASEMNADVVALKLTATGAVQQNLVFYTDSKLVSDLADLGSQAVRDAMKLAPSSGDPTAGSLDKHLDEVQAKTDALPAQPAAVGSAMALTTDTLASIKGSPTARTVAEAYDKAETARATAAAAKAVTDKLDTAMQLDGSVYRFTQNALEEAPASEGVADWTADEKKQIRQALGLSGTAAATTGDGNLDAALDRLDELLGVPVLQAAAIASAGQDITFFRGDTKPIAFDLGRDITGAALKFTVKRRATDPQSAALVAKSSAQVSQIEITDAEEGQFAVKLVAADTADLLPDGRRASFLYDVEMTLDGEVETVFAGAFVLLPDITTG